MKKLLFLTLVIPSFLFSQIPDHKRGTYIDDLAGVVNDSTEHLINMQLREIEDSFGVQMAIVLIDKLPEKYGIEGYAREIGRKWHVGNAKNGIVYVAAISQHMQRLEVADHLEGAIPDITAGRFLAALKPYFRAEKYGYGLINMAIDLRQKLETYKAEQQKITADELDKKISEKSKHSFWFWSFVWIIVTVPVFFFIKYKRRQRLKEKAESLEREKRIEEGKELNRLSYQRTLKRHAVTNNIASKYDKYGNRRNPDDDAAVLPTPSYKTETKKEDDSYKSSNTDTDTDSYTSSSSSSTDYGNYGSGSSDSTLSSDSGFSGGGATDNW